jgi:hypothetical protein
MKMFVWKDAYRVSYGNAVAVAVAETVEEARSLLRSAGRSHYGMDPFKDESQGCDIGTRAPDRILDLPCAEIYEWSE